MTDDFCKKKVLNLFEWFKMCAVTDLTNNELYAYYPVFKFNVQSR